MISVKFQENKISIDGLEKTLDYPIKEAFLINDMVIVLFDPDANLGSQGQFKNLISINRMGDIVWIAEMPTDNNTDVYYKISKKKPLTVYSFCSFECEINIKNGKIIRKDFFK